MSLSVILDRTALGRTLRAPLRFMPPNAQVPILAGVLRGKKWVVGAGSYEYWLGSYEYAVQKELSAAILPGYTVYDLGANVGFYSLLASALVGPSGRVFSFEPLPRNLRFLRKHVELNRIRNCSISEVAVGHHAGIARFNSDQAPTMSHATFESSGNLDIEVVALDELIVAGRLAPPDLIKCDIGGGEYDALFGAARTLAAYGPTVFLATHGSAAHEQCCRLLTDLQFKITPLDGRPLDLSRAVVATHRTKPFKANLRI